jgi:hypothetical protein
VYETELPSVDNDAREENAQRDLEYEDGDQVRDFASYHPLIKSAWLSMCIYEFFCPMTHLRKHGKLSGAGNVSTAAMIFNVQYAGAIRREKHLLICESQNPSRHTLPYSSENHGCIIPPKLRDNTRPSPYSQCNEGPRGHEEAYCNALQVLAAPRQALLVVWRHPTAAQVDMEVPYNESGSSDCGVVRHQEGDCRPIIFVPTGNIAVEVEKTEL